MRPGLLAGVILIAAVALTAGIFSSPTKPQQQKKSPPVVAATNKENLQVGASASSIRFATLPAFVEEGETVSMRERVIPLPPPPMEKRQSTDLVEFAGYFKREPEKMFEERVVIERGDTLIQILQDLGFSRTDGHVMVEKLAEVWDPRSLRPGHELSIVYAKGAALGDATGILGFYFRPNVEHDIIIYRDGSSSDKFAADKIKRELERKLVYANAEIDGSLFDAGSRAGIPTQTLVSMIRAFSYDVDFQRDLHPGDSFSLLYERYDDKEGKLARTGNILYATLHYRNRKREVFHFEHADNNGEFYDRSGQSVRKALLRTPIDGARISSGYGMRQHPIMGYSRMHRGVDFAAPTGTPIRAAGQGVIEKIGWWGAYGNYVRIRHNNDYSTAYAHASRFRSGLKVGSRVNQGDVIAYVGSTGRSTGPHLHYEILYKGNQVNPSGVNIPQGEQLAGRRLQEFKEHIKEIERELKSQRENQAVLVARKATATTATAN